MKKVVIGCLGALALAAAGGAFLVWFWLFRDLPVLEAALSLPLEAETDSTVTMVVTVTNVHKRAVTLDSIDIDNGFLEGFQVVSIEPRPTDTMRIPVIDQRSWEFGRAVAPGETVAVTFTMRAVAAGRYSGDIDVCNPNQDFKTLYADIIVRKK